jgi:cytochrome oxidase Cu insertion factor (SCO1/SenC/PrrC family)
MHTKGFYSKMSSPFVIGLKRGLKISVVLVIFYLLLDYFYFSKLANKNIVTLENKESVSIGGDFDLLGKDGKEYNLASFKGKPLIIFFGFASCPDICPYGLTMISSVLDTLGDDSNMINAVFVTLDPERDDYTSTAQFASMFHEKIIGLSGSISQIDRIANAWRVYKKKVELPDSALVYTIDHSAFIYLMDKNGKYYTHFSHNTEPEEIIKELDKVL